MNRILVYGMTANPGGIESYVMNQFSLLDPEKAVFDFIVDFPQMCYDEDVKQKGSLIHFIPAKGKKLLSHWLGFYKVLKHHPEYKKVYFNILDAGAVFSMLVPWLMGREIIVHSHNGSTEKMRLHNICKPFLKLIAKKRYACSKVAAEYMFDTTDVDVIPNAINCEKYKFNELIRSAKRKELGISDDTLAICFVGRLTYQKNVHFLNKVFHQLIKSKPNTVLLVVGDGEEKEKMIADSKEMGSFENIKFLGKRNDVNEILQATDVFVMTSFFEGLSVVAIEAQASGVSCVFSDRMSKETKINDNVSFVSLDDSAECWAKAILKAAETPRSQTVDKLQKQGYDLGFLNKNQNEFLEYLYE